VESYLAGVIGGEMGPRRGDERQAMLAQAVVSRTFALKNRGRWEPQGFDAWADVRDQVYAGLAGETAEAWGALRATRGEVLRYRGDLIYAYFHSTCGFSTAGADEAFKTAQSQPYLRPISDASGAGWGHGVGFCQWGAVGRARAGQDYRKIVTTYFPGTNVERLY